VKRIVTAVNSAGRSYVVSNEVVADAGFATIWEIDPKQVRDWIARIDPAQAAVTIEPKPGASRWVIATIPPDTNGRATPMAVPGLDEHGFHTTRTVDYDLVLEGRVILVLDEGQVELDTGDLVVQQATRHAWRNPGKTPARLLAVLTTLS
jgi:mannose-6-phosphate isomerase-like protein (cupin superfamily)